MAWFKWHCFHLRTMRLARLARLTSWYVQSLHLDSPFALCFLFHFFNIFNTIVLLWLNLFIVSLHFQKPIDKLRWVKRRTHFCNNASFFAWISRSLPVRVTYTSDVQVRNALATWRHENRSSTLFPISFFLSDNWIKYFHFWNFMKRNFFLYLNIARFINCLLRIHSYLNSFHFASALDVVWWRRRTWTVSSNRSLLCSVCFSFLWNLCHVSKPFFFLSVLIFESVMTHLFIECFISNKARTLSLQVKKARHSFLLIQCLSDFLVCSFIFRRVATLCDLRKREERRGREKRKRERVVCVWLWVSSGTTNYSAHDIIIF